jgi:hypothetical protein
LLTASETVESAEQLRDPAETSLRVNKGMALCVALIHDLGAWLAQTKQPVALADYQLSSAIRSMSDPRERLQCYLDPALFARWERTLTTWFEAGLGFRPELVPTSRIKLTGISPGALPTAQVILENRSWVCRGESQEQHLRTWRLTMVADPDLESIRDAFFEALGR